MDKDDMPRLSKYVKNLNNPEYQTLNYGEEYARKVRPELYEDEVKIDPRFYSPRQDGRCYQLFSDMLMCKRKHGEKPGTVCDWFVRRVNSICPINYLERWEQVLDDGLLFRVS